MKISKKINLQVTAIILSLISFFIILNVVLVTSSYNKLSQYIGDTYHNQSISTIDDIIHILKATTEKVSSDEKIIEVLYNNRNNTISTNEDIDIMESQINLFEKILEPFSFIQTINIINLQGNYLFSDGNLYEQLNKDNYPWLYEDTYSYNLDKPFITNLHKDINTNKYMIEIEEFTF